MLFPEFDGCFREKRWFLFHAAASELKDGLSDFRVDFP